MARKPADKVGMVVRFSEALRRRIEKAAQANNQSMNSEIVRRLEESFRRDERLEEKQAVIDTIDRRLGEWLEKRAEEDRRRLAPPGSAADVAARDRETPPPPLGARRAAEEHDQREDKK